MKNETNTQHTPGPWKIKTAGTFDNAGIIGQVRLPSEKGKYWITIAECDYDAYIKGISAHQTDHHKRSNDVAFLRSLQKANAQLIARAPELLKENEQLKDEALEFQQLYRDTKALNAELLEALKEAIQYGKNSLGVKTVWYNKVESAIAKAEAKNLPVS